MIRWKKNWYLVHRWLGLIVGLQLLAWSVGGFAFTIMHINNVRGNVDRKPHTEPVLDLKSVNFTPQEAIARASIEPENEVVIEQAVLRMCRGRMVYDLLGPKRKPLACVDAASGEVTQRISESQAIAAAQEDFAHDADVISITLLEGEPPQEYRGGRMPVYQVILDHPKEPHLYVCPVTGEILKRRNYLWRIFDFFWMLHIMDYGERENFNHWLLTGMSVLAIATSASGLVLWWWRIPQLRGRANRKKVIIS